MLVVTYSLLWCWWHEVHERIWQCFWYVIAYLCVVLSFLCVARKLVLGTLLPSPVSTIQYRTALHTDRMRPHAHTLSYQLPTAGTRNSHSFSTEHMNSKNTILHFIWLEFCSIPRCWRRRWIHSNLVHISGKSTLVRTHFSTKIHIWKNHFRGKG